MTKPVTKYPNPTTDTSEGLFGPGNAIPGVVTAVSFTVPGTAAPQGSKRHVGHGRMIESSKAVGPWRERVALVAHQTMRDPGPHELITGPVTVAINFVLHRPVSTPKRRTPPAVKKPDLDKLVRAILDAITGIVIADDSQVINLVASKELAQLGEAPHARISVEACQ